MSSVPDCYCLDGSCTCVACKVCREWTSNADGLCRDCDIDKLIAEWLHCPCGARLMNPSVYPRQPHTDTCPHAETGAFDPVDEAERPMDPLRAAYAAGFRAGFHAAGGAS